METVETTVRQFIQLPGILSAVDFLRERLPHQAEIFIVGGAIRNLIITQLFGHAPPTEDVDIFIGGLRNDFSLRYLLEGEDVESTELDGIRWHPATSDLAFDLCLLQKFVTLQKYRLAPTRLNLLACIDFTINTILFEVNTGALFENNCIAAIEKRCLDFNTHRYYTKQLTAYRVLLIRHKTGFMLSEGVFAFLKHQLSVTELSDLTALFKNKVGKSKTRALMADYDYVCAYPNYPAYAAAIKGRN